MPLASYPENSTAQLITNGGFTWVAVGRILGTRSGRLTNVDIILIIIVGWRSDKYLINVLQLGV